MPNLNAEEIKKLKKGELCGNIALIVTAIACVAFIILFSVAMARAENDLRIYSAAVFVPVIGVFTLISALCNLKFGKALDRITKDYVRGVFIENAALMHPERDSLTYTVSCNERGFAVKVNNFKEEIIFDFSAFGKLSALRKAGISTAIAERICATFCRLYERGGKYKTVTYTAKKGKVIPVIENGVPDKRAYKNYLKTK